MDSVKLELFRSINDPIHGSIRMSNQEMQVIEHPLFKRLNHVRQNSFLYKVFPSAKHTRFEHSIGVMHLSSKILSTLIDNSEIADKGNDMADYDVFYNHINVYDGIGINLNTLLNEDLLIKIYKQLRFAALFHDIGHGPLSHLFDAFAPTIDEFGEILKSDEILIQKDNDIFEAIMKMLYHYQQEKSKKIKAQEVRIEHEHVSSYFTYLILRNIDPSVIRNVLTILKPELQLSDLMVKWGDMEINVIPLLNDIVASAPIDCDRMDYLKRDSYFAGVPYGNYSEDRILKSMLPYISSKDGVLDAHLGLKYSGLHAIENFLQARYEMYVQVYGHKTNEACSFMLEELEKSENKSFRDWTDINLQYEEFQALYIGLTDESFLNKLSLKLSEEGKHTIERLEKRDLWKRIYEVEEFIQKDKEDTKLKEVFNKEFENMKTAVDNNLKLFIGDRFPLKDFKNAAKILEKTSNSYYIVSDSPLSSASQIIESLNKGLRVWRIYSPKNDGIQELRQYARKEIHPKIKESEISKTSK
jgi:HD superfamily phosphohydrolase